MGKIDQVRSSGILAVLTLFFSSLLFFYDIFTGRFLFTERDLGPYFIPPRFFWAESIKHGDFPLWNPYQFAGHPFFANPQHAILYPLNLLFLFLPFDAAFNAIIILHFFLGGWFTYLFLRDLKVSPTGSLISGLILMLSGYLLSVHSLLTCLLSVVWTPLIMMFFGRAICSRGFKNEILTAIFISISFLGGGIEIVYGNFFLLSFMAIFSSSLYPLSSHEEIRGEKRWKRIWLGVRCLFIVTTLFLFLSAVQLIPFLELYIHSIRGKGISYQEATLWSFAPKDTLLFFLPDAYGYFLDMKKYWVTQCWLKTLYTGGLPFILSILFFISGKGRKFFFSLMFFSIFLSLGHDNPLYLSVFKYVPFFNGIRYPVKFLYLFILALSITAGLGFQRLTELSKENEKKGLKNLLIAFSLASGVLLLCLALGHAGVEHFLRLQGIDFPHFNYLSVNLHHAKRFLFYLALFFLLLRVGCEVKWKGWIRILLLLFLTADLLGNMGFYGKEKTSDYFEKTKIIETISSDKGHFRIFSTEKTTSLDTPILIDDLSPLYYLKEKHLPSMNLLYPLHDIWGIDVIRLKRTDDLYRALIGTPSISATHLIDFYGVKYVISVTPIEGDPRFELIYSRLEGLKGEKKALLSENTIKLYRYRQPHPRAWLVKDFRILEGSEILSTLLKKEFDLDREVLLEEKPKWLHPAAPPFANGGLEELEDTGRGLPQQVEIISEKNSRLRLLVKSKGDNLLVLSDTNYPGWKALVNGATQKVYQANYAFRAVPVSAGTQRVEFVYDPMSFKLGAGVTFLGILGCIGMGWMARRRRAP